MKRNAVLIGLGVIALLAVAAAAVLFLPGLLPGEKSGWDSVRLLIPMISQEQPAETKSDTLLPMVGNGQPAEPGSAAMASPSHKEAPPPAGSGWQAVPTCAVDPLTVEEWQRMLADPSAAAAQEITLQRASRLAPEAAQVDGAALSAGQANALQAQDDSSVYTALLMNVASGRINRATEISLAAFPDFKTVGDLLDRFESGAAVQRAPAAAASPSLADASRQVLEGSAIVRPVCARLLVMQAGNLIEDVEWSSNGLAAEAVQAGAVNQAYKVIGEGAASPDGEWAAFRSGGMDTGGPVFLLNLKTGQWTDLVEAMRAAAPDPTALPESYSWWDVIGWLPDSRRLVIGPADLPWVFVVNLDTFAYQPILLNTFGLGGSDLVHLAADGSRLVYIANDTSGTQQLTTVDLATGQSTAHASLAYTEGVMQYPRFSPDGKRIAYVVQKGNPLTGLTYAIQLFSLDGGDTRVLVEGSLGATRPVWSPDGLHIAYTRRAGDTPDVVSPDQAPEPVTNNLWVISVDDGQTWQVTALEGQVANPAWAQDSQTLSFVTGEGRVGLVDIQQSGSAWVASEAASVMPQFTTTFFVP